MFPGEFFKVAGDDGMITDLQATTMRNHSGDEIPVRFRAFEIKYKDKKTNKIAFISDLSVQKKDEER